MSILDCMLKDYQSDYEEIITKTFCTLVYHLKFFENKLMCDVIQSIKKENKSKIT